MKFHRTRQGAGLAFNLELEGDAGDHERQHGRERNRAAVDGQRGRGVALFGPLEKCPHVGVPAQCEKSGLVLQRGCHLIR